MHELSIAAAILEAAQREVVLHQNAPLQKIAVRLGELAAVDAEALRFSFEMITKATEFEPVELELEDPAYFMVIDCEKDLSRDRPLVADVAEFLMSLLCLG